MADRNYARTNISGCRINWLIPILLVALLAGCALKVKLVGEYDEILDQKVTDLYKSTSSFFVKLKSSSGNEGSYIENKDFYIYAQGEVATLILRAQVTEEGLKRNPLTQNFNDLQKQYEDLATLHKTSPTPAMIKSAEKAFEQSFRAILQNLLYLKWNQHQPEAKQ